MEIDDPVDSAMLDRLAAVAKLEQLRQVRL
jgi:hypothetical protein